MQAGDRVTLKPSSPLYASGFRRGVVVSLTETTDQFIDRIAPTLDTSPRLLRTRLTRSSFWDQDWTLDDPVPVLRLDTPSDTPEPAGGWELPVNASHFVTDNAEIR